MADFSLSSDDVRSLLIWLSRYPGAQVCRHAVAVEILDRVEKRYGKVSAQLVDAVVSGDDATQAVAERAIAGHWRVDPSAVEVTVERLPGQVDGWAAVAKVTGTRGSLGVFGRLPELPHTERFSTTALSESIALQRLIDGSFYRADDQVGRNNPDSTPLYDRVPPSTTDALARFSAGEATADDVRVLVDNAGDQVFVQIQIRRTRPPRRGGAIQLLGRSGPPSSQDRSITADGHGLYSAWWRVADLRLWLDRHVNRGGSRG